MNTTETRHADFSKDRLYRYMLEIIWDDALPRVTFVGCNPSTADEVNDDPTIRRCKQFAKDFGAGRLTMLNIFGYRATDPRRLSTIADPVGEMYKTMDVYLKAALFSKFTIAAWGNYTQYVPKRLIYRGREVAEAIPNLMCLRQSEKTTMPAHPLYLPGDLIPIPFRY